MAAAGRAPYVFSMKVRQLLGFAAVAAIAGVVTAGVPEGEKVYTSEDLDRMFGPAPKSPSDPVDKSRPEDWRFVQHFLDRQYSRIDADRRHELEVRTVEVAEARTPAYARYPYGAVSWGLGYPASTWWQTVWSSYSGCSADDRHEHRRHARRPGGRARPRTP